MGSKKNSRHQWQSLLKAHTRHRKQSLLKKLTHHRKQSLLKKFDLKQYLHEKRRLMRLRQRLYGPISECDTKERLLQDERNRRRQKLVKKMVYGLTQNRIERYEPKNLWQAKQKRTEKSQRQRKLRYQHRNDNAFFSPALHGVKFKIRKSRAEFLRQGKPKLAASSAPLTNLFSIVGRLTQWEDISLNYPDDIPDFEFPPKNVLDIIGIEATEVGLSNGAILFNPCFFRPYPQEEQSLLEKFPIEDDWPIPLTLVRPDQTEESAKEDMRIQRMMYPSEKAAKREYLFDQEAFDLGMAEWRRERPGAYDALHHVQDHLFKPRRKVNREGVRENPSNLLSRTKWR